MKCIICGSEFEPRDKRQICCKRECSVKNSKQKTRGRYVKRPAREPGRITQDYKKCIAYVSDKTCKIITVTYSPSMCGRDCAFFQTKEQFQKSCAKAKERCVKAGVTYQHLFGDR